MRRYFSILALILLTGLLYLACVREDPLLKAAKEHLVSQEIYGMYKDRQAVFIYDADKHQLADNAEALYFRIQNDSQNTILQMTLDQEPDLGKKCLMTIDAKGLSGIETSYSVEVVKMDESKQTLWLFDQTGKTGFVMFYRF
ncbi:MAG TPA: hypothetical protein PLX61_08420 [Bacteroidales bacterium]|jgi:hypothetical protein|nr:hypothetical protein [Bacteroidales bacterium]HNZ81234.1 hypothetical protein [Bacteroidales bacterium]HOH24676.1 hypothetical protein [Bacteroidales bacterium]HPB36316.1 hypothetical protein [Bacteroidales bacterium]HPY58898.1 hypothetical protein [Bacteroidales bacterium]